MCTSVLPACMYVCIMCVIGACGHQIGYRWLWATGWILGSDLDPPEEQPMCLTGGPSLQPHRWQIFKENPITPGSVTLSLPHSSFWTLEPQAICSWPRNYFNSSQTNYWLAITWLIRGSGCRLGYICLGPAPELAEVAEHKHSQPPAIRNTVRNPLPNTFLIF